MSTINLAKLSRQPSVLLTLYPAGLSAQIPVRCTPIIIMMEKRRGCIDSNMAVLQVRAFAYQDTQRYRLGTNFSQLPVNRPRSNRFNPMRRDGAACYQYGLGNTPAYYPSSFQTIDAAPQYAAPHKENWSGRVVEFESKMDEEDFQQPRDFWERILAKEAGQQESLVSNVAEHLAEAAPRIREKAYGRCCFSIPVPLSFAPLFPRALGPILLT